MIPCPDILQPNNLETLQRLEDGSIMVMYVNGTIVHFHPVEGGIYSVEVLAIPGRVL